MRILGVDPGLSITGYGCVSVNLNTPEAGNRIILIEGGVIRTKSSNSLGSRLAVLFEDFTEIIKDFKPDVVVIEDLYSHYKNPRTAIIMGHARGTLIAASSCKGIEIVPYSANRVKKSLTGHGHSTKEQMQRMIMTLLGLKTPPSPADVADALAIALCHANVVIHGHNISQ